MIPNDSHTPVAGSDQDHLVHLLKENLSVQNSRMAAERTLMAWIRTSLSMISFGFTIYKFMQAMHSQDPTRLIRADAPRNVGLTLIAIGTFALILACIQHIKYITGLGLHLRDKFWDISLLVGMLIGLLGFLMFWSIVFNAGPLS